MSRRNAHNGVALDPSLKRDTWFSTGVSNLVVQTHSRHWTGNKVLIGVPSWTGEG